MYYRTTTIIQPQDYAYHCLWLQLVKCKLFKLQLQEPECA